MLKQMIMLFCCSVAAVQAAPQWLDAVALHEDLNLAVQIESLPTAQKHYAQHTQRLYIPASTQKLYTSLAALAYLGFEYTIQTQLYVSNPKVHFGRLDSDVYVKFNGDPSLTTRDLTALLQSLRARGVKQVRGNIYIDDYAYAPASLGPGWMWDDAKDCYSAAAGAAILDHNCIPMKMRGLRTHTLAHIQTDKPSYLINRIKTVPIIYAHDDWQVYPLKNNKYLLRGEIRANTALHDNDLTILDATTYLHQQIRQIFLSLGIKWQGQLHQRATPHTAYLIAAHQSPPVWALVQKLLKDSDNLYADSLFKQLGAIYTHRQGSWASGQLATNAILAKLGIHSARMVDGSGLSRYNLSNTQTLVKVLRYLYYNVPMASLLIPKLRPAQQVSVVEQVLADDLPSIRAKTGSMSSVVGLAGIVFKQDGADQVFAILMNGFRSQFAKHRRLAQYIIVNTTDKT